MLEPGIRTAEHQHLRDPSCSVPVARGPAERRETTRSADLVETLQELLSPRVEGLCEGMDVLP